MSVQDFLLPLENIRFQSKTFVHYANKKYKFLITDKRIILYVQRDHLIQSEDIVSESLDRLQGIEYTEKGLVFREAKISIKGVTNIEIRGPASDLKPVFHLIESLIKSDDKLSIKQELQTSDPWQLTNMTKDLKHLLVRAAFINENTSQSYSFSFTSILLAFLVSHDPISKWFQEYAEKKEIKIDDILNYREISKDKLQEIREKQISDDNVANLSFGSSVTKSGRDIFDKTLEIQKGSNNGQYADMGVRHIMGAYIYNNPTTVIALNHGEQMRKWNFDAEDWSNSFLAQISSLFEVELNLWLNIHLQTFSKLPKISPILPTYITSDMWTTKDALGYRSYTYTLARFLGSDKTTAPISISIQAPWGGGKTSLMRMLRDMLDKDAPKTESFNYKSVSNKPKKEEVKVKDIKKELAECKKQNKDHPEPKIPESIGWHIKPVVTIWFNAWKYESTEQVWAGLADSIVKGVADRMDPVGREWFYLRLNLKRRDIDSIRQWITEHTLSYIWQNLKPWLSASIIGIGASTMTAVIGAVGQNPYTPYASLFGAISSAGMGVFQALDKKKDAEDKPAALSLGKFVKVPDYNEKVGFIHNVVKDLQLVFETIREDCLPMVIFIDDLDRCSPSNIAQVIEGINLFLAGEFEFKDCMFILGIDTEMVAAALEVDHKEVISKLPSYPTHMPIGWRFMDKFIQLPIIITPSIGEKARKYANSLLNNNYSSEEQKTVNKKDEDDELDTSSAVSGSQKDVNNKKVTFDSFGAELKEMDEKINKLPDVEEEFYKQISEAACDFSNNPRDIKRFINILRFQRLLMTSIDKGKSTPSFDQVSRWIILSLKWPQLIRWLYWSPAEILYDIKSSEPSHTNFVKSRLERLEKCSTEEDWYNKLKEVLQIKVDDNNNNVNWINDKSLQEFFKRESTLYKNEPLSSGAGLGVY